MDRRDFLRFTTASGLTWTLGACRTADPRAGTPPNPHGGKWLGEDFSAGHVLREEKPPDLSGAAEGAAADVLIVGGGISGLVAARALANAGRTVRILEQAAEPGGNAKSAEWGGIAYSTGAAYFCRPDEGSAQEALYRELGVLDRAVKVPKGEAFLGGTFFENLWEGQTDPANAAATRAFRETWRALYDERYPAVPWDAECGWSEAEFAAADRRPFSAYLEEAKAPPHVRRFCEHYCWSSLGGAASEISSYVALNFLTAEFGEILALPGGNAGVARALVASLDPRQVAVDTGTMAVRVAAVKGGVEVRTLAGGRPRVQRARAAILAIPRFIGAMIVDGFPKERKDIVEDMEWRAYVVANVLLSRRPSREWYDAYTLDPLERRPGRWTDLILADFAGPKRPDRSVITAYCPLPFEDARRLLENEKDYRELREAIRRDLPEALPALGLRLEDIVDINLTRWGHPLVLAKPGQLAGGAMERLSAPLGPITFAHQDRFGVPAIETAIDAGFRAAEEAAAVAGG